MKRHLVLCTALLLTLAIGVGPARSSTAGRLSSVRARAAAVTPLYGVTIDQISHLQRLISSLAALPERPTTRVYFGVHEPASYYAQALQQLDPVTGVMGELLDSSDEKAISVGAFQERTESYLSTLGTRVSIWEVGNEVNGNWTGSYPTVAEKLTEAYDDVATAGGQTALTLYANDFGPDHCGDGEAELTPLQFSQQYVPSQVADGLNYVLLSYYPTQCGGIEPTSEELVPYLEQLHAVYPNALLGFGEVGLPKRVRKSTRAQAEEIMQWAYSLKPGLGYYIGGYFWWYAAEDALKPKAPLQAALPAAFGDESAAFAAAPAALAPSSP